MTSKEKMAELIIEIPERWLNFINDYCEVTGTNRDTELAGNIEGIIYMFTDELEVKDMVRLVEKHHLTDIRKIAPRERDEAAGIPRRVKPVDPMGDAISLVVGKPEFEVAYKRLVKEAFLEVVRTLPPEELAMVTTALSSA